MPANHRDVDQNDRGNPLGTANVSGDNTGNSFEGADADHWFTKADHKIKKGMKQKHNPNNNKKILGKAKTQIDGNHKTTVIFNASDDGGDDFKIIAC